MNWKQKIGNWGQELAKEYLLQKGYQFINQNFHSRFGEVDLIFYDQDQLVFVEVKTRTSAAYGLPEEAITESKKEKLVQTALEYLDKNEIADDNFRLDCLAIELDSENQVAKIRHHRAI